MIVTHLLTSFRSPTADRLILVIKCQDFVFAVKILFLMWTIGFWCKQFVSDVSNLIFDVSNLYLM